MVPLSETELERLRELVSARLSGHSLVQPGEFLDNLVFKIFRRYPPRQDWEDDEEAGEVRLAQLEGGEDAAAAFCVEAVEAASTSPYFPLVQQVALSGDDQAMQQLMAMLDRNLRIRGIIYRHGHSPEEHHPAIWGKVWEAIPKWDGRDFRAYVARIVRNYCLDEISRKKRGPLSIGETDPRDKRGSTQTGSTVATRDAMNLVMAVMDELEANGRIKALDGVMFTLVSRGRSVADIIQAFRSSGVPGRVRAATEALGGRLKAADAVLIRFLADGLEAEDVAGLTGRPPEQVQAIAKVLGAFPDEDERMVAKILAREGMRTADLERAERLTTNAVNLCLNRIRLKVWMGLCDRAYESLRRRGAVSDVEEAIVQQRCLHAPPDGCRMYKDSTCKREVDPMDIARRAGLDMDGVTLARQMADLRRKLVEQGLGLIFPDYNSCLIERKPVRK